jgi:hypothetical protein
LFVVSGQDTVKAEKALRIIPPTTAVNLSRGEASQNPATKPDPDQLCIYHYRSGEEIEEEGT